MPTIANNYLVSVIVPIYNAEPYLKQCLESIVDQSLRAIEILCIDDGSTDQSLSIMRTLASQDTRIRVIAKPNQGYGATCNKGLDEARGEWIAIVEPDDWIEQDMYSNMLAFADTLSCKPDIIKTPYWRILMPDTPEQRKVNCSYRNRISPERQPFPIREASHLLEHHPSVWSALYRKNFLDDQGIRFHEYPGAGWADNPFLIDTLCQTNLIAYLDTPYYCYREETLEKTALFTRQNTLLPLARWNDMMDSLERLNISDKGVLLAHNRRGFTYLRSIREEVDLNNPDLNAEMVRMFARMDTDLVLFDPQISPSNKRLFAELLGLPNPSPKIIPYAWYLIKQGFYNLKNIGLLCTWKMMRIHLKKRRNREGR